ncbi:MAG: hypothetical protein CL608_12465 [Anaerolineaceae bacterium]|nr:hypothetical protein [Anaerolineaceae bacterium]
MPGRSQLRFCVGRRPCQSRGLISSIIGAELIDTAFQLYNDWAQGLCLSPNQYFWRAYVALLFGLGAGAVGAAAVFLLVAAGAPVIVAGLGGFAVSTGLGLYFERKGGEEEQLRNNVTEAAGRW